MRTLYDCINARYPTTQEEYIKCSKGYKLGSGNIHKRQVDRGDRLMCRICQVCLDFEPFDTPFENT